MTARASWALVHAGRPDSDAVAGGRPGSGFGGLTRGAGVNALSPSNIPRGSSVVEDHEVEPAETLGVGEQIDGGDLSVGDREGEHDPGPPSHRPYGSRGSVDERVSRNLGAPREGLGH